MEQLPLIKNNTQQSYLPEDYILSKSNLTAYQHIIVEEWQQHCMILYGSPGTGKSHLANIWGINNRATFLNPEIRFPTHDVSGSYILEDIEKISDPVSLLHLYNSTKENKCKLLFTTNTLPKLLPYQLADLRSRLLSVPLLKLLDGDQNLLKIILFKEFSLRQMHVSPGVINYIINHAERSIHRLIKIVDIIDTSSLQSKHKITIPLKTIIDSMNSPRG